MIEGEGAKVLHLLEGRELDAVTFVRDYVQFHFEGPLLNAYVWPTVLVGTVRHAAGTLGYRDELCARIGRTVSSAREANEHMSLSFNDGSSIEISLRIEDRSGPEAALLDDGSGRVWNVW